MSLLGIIVFLLVDYIVFDGAITKFLVVLAIVLAVIGFIVFLVISLLGAIA